MNDIVPVAQVNVGELREIPGYEGLYAVARDGRVWSFHSNRWLALTTLRNGYPSVHLSIDGKARRRTVHRIVASAFVPNPHNYPQVNHLDGTRTNNTAENLEWCTGSMNMVHAHATGLQPHTDRMREVARQKALAMNRRKRALSDDAVADVRASLVRREKQKDIARRYGVDAMVISNIKRGRTYVESQ